MAVTSGVVGRCVAILVAEAFALALAAMAITVAPAPAAPAPATALAMVLAAIALAMLAVSRTRVFGRKPDLRLSGGVGLLQFALLFLDLHVALGGVVHGRCGRLHHYGCRWYVARRQSLQALNAEFRRHQGFVRPEVDAEALADLQFGQGLALVVENEQRH